MSESSKAEKEGYTVLDLTVYPLRDRADQHIKMLAPPKELFQKWKNKELNDESFKRVYEFYLWKHKRSVKALINKGLKGKKIALRTYNKEFVEVLLKVMHEIWHDEYRKVC